MSLPCSRCDGGGDSLTPREQLAVWLAEAGAYRFGVARAGSVDPTAMRVYDRWIAESRHGTMEYMERYRDVRADVRNLLPGARSVIVCAFSYYTPAEPGADAVRFARYALGDDYHEVIRRRLTTVAGRMSEHWGAGSRVCVDTAPLPERYWAVRSGLGFIGRNRQLIIPGAGSYFVLGEIVTTLDLGPEADAEAGAGCGECRKCIEACPGRALTDPGAGEDDSGLDARRCNSYLTIEYRGELPADLRLGRRIYGCDVCAEVCPHNARPPEAIIEEFRPRPRLLSLTREEIAAMTQEQFSTLFRHSAVKRAKLAGLLRNARHN